MTLKRKIDISKNNKQINFRMANAALHSYVETNARPKQSWIQHPNNLISVVAITLSVFGVIYGFYKDWKDSINKDLQALSTVVVELTKLDTETASLWTTPAAAGAQNAAATVTNDGNITANLEAARINELGRSITNRRVALLAEADRLTAHLGGRAPITQMAVLGAAYGQALQFEKAKQYFELLTPASNSPTLRVTAWRSIAAINSRLGPDYESATRDAFTKAAQVNPNPQDFGSIGLLFEVYQQSAEFEFLNRQYATAFKQMILARTLAGRLPCPMGSMLVAQVRNAMQTRANYAVQMRIPLDASLMDDISTWLRTPGC